MTVFKNQFQTKSQWVMEVPINVINNNNTINRLDLSVLFQTLKALPMSPSFPDVIAGSYGLSWLIYT